MDNFSEEQTYALVTELGIEIVSDTDRVWMCLCPFHGNMNSPAFAVNKTNGTFICFNEACGASGNMTSLVTNITGKNMFAALRMVARAKEKSPQDVTVLIKKNLSDEPLPSFSQATLDGLYAAFWKSPEAQEYMKGRGFNEPVLDHYRIGYSPKKRLVTVPMHDVSGNPVGLVGRTIEGKRFRNSDDLPKSRTLWNIHRAKRHPKAVICEASFDAMRIWQATGYEALAALGSSFSEEQAAQINKYFTHLVIFTDDDQKPTVNQSCRKCKENGHRECQGHNTGLELGMKIARACKGINITWAHLDSKQRYDGMKDAGDMTDQQIRYAIENAVPHIEMVRKGSQVAKSVV